MEKEVKSTFLYISNYILKTLQKSAEFFLEDNYKLFFLERKNNSHRTFIPSAPTAFVAFQVTVILQ